MILTRKTASRPGPTRPRAVIATPRVAASAAQRRKVARLCCLVCGREPVDPAHAVPRRLGGCNSPDCVVPLCRAHHRSFDTSGLAVVPYLGHWWRTSAFGRCLGLWRRDQPQLGDGHGRPHLRDDPAREAAGLLLRAPWRPPSSGAAILARGRLEESASGFEGSCQEWLEALIAYTPPDRRVPPGTRPRGGRERFCDRADRHLVGLSRPRLTSGDRDRPTTGHIRFAKKLVPAWCPLRLVASAA